MAAWFEDHVPVELTYDNNGAPAPLRDHPFVKESADISSFVKKAFENHQEVGRRIPVKKYEKPEEVENWRKEHLPKLYTAGLLKAPPGKVEDYKITRPEKMPTGLNWSDDRAGKVAAIMHKHGIATEAVPELMDVYTEALLENQFDLKMNYDQGVAALKAEFGAEYDVKSEEAKRLVPLIFKNPNEIDMFERSGLANHPAFLGPMMRLARFAINDSSVLPSGSQGSGAGSATHDEVRAEVSKIATDKTHPMHAGYLISEPKVMEYIDSLYKKIPGSDKVIVVGQQGVGQNG